LAQLGHSHLAATQLITHFQSRAPVDILGLANALGLNVWEDDLPDGISGKLFRDADNGGVSGYSILVNSPEPPVRKRFTTAHEIAHFILHREVIDSGIEDDALYRSRLSNAMEAAANRLAADILMPYRLIRDLQREGWTEIPDLAKELQVSQHALSIRLGVPVVA
jgi:hypothetical protein